MKKIKVYSTDQPIKRKRRRIGEFTDEIRRFKQSLTIDQRIELDLRLMA